MVFIRQFTSQKSICLRLPLLFFITLFFIIGLFPFVGTLQYRIAYLGNHYPALSSLIATAQSGTLPAPENSGIVSGDLMQWHTVSITFVGPDAAEQQSDPNPFLDYRLTVNFVGPNGEEYVVPGFYAADGVGGATGDVAATGQGNMWRVHFSPNQIGTWSYSASFRAGENVAIDLDVNSGTSTAFDGASGSFDILPSNKDGSDFRSPDKGWLRNQGNHYLTFAGSGRPWLKGGPDIPENFLGYDGFDNTPDFGHSFAAHATDWNEGDPDWGIDGQESGAGRNIIGALNFIAEKGANSIYFLPMNIGGDGDDTFPTIDEDDKTHYDISKLAQWEILFSHAQSKGIFLHFQLAETESGNENYHDGGELGIERKLYYRELIARFGHHPGLEWNVGEENDYGTEKRLQFFEYIRQVDPYDHPVTTHTHGNDVNSYDELLDERNDGNPIYMDMTSFQTSKSSLDLAEVVQTYRQESAAAGTPWVISVDEPQRIDNDKDDDSLGYPHGRQRKMWPAYMAGAGGFEWYVQRDGGGHSFDQAIDDYNQMDVALEWTGYALDFFARLPLLDMDACSADLASSDSRRPTYCLANESGYVYALYNEDGGELTLDLSDAAGDFSVRWFDPRNGGPLQVGTVSQVSGGSTVNLGEAPNNPNEDWAAIVRLDLRTYLPFTVDSIVAD